MIIIKAYPEVGSTIEQAVKDAIQLANHLNVKVEFEHNTVPVLAYPGANIDALCESYRHNYLIMAEAEQRHLNVVVNNLDSRPGGVQVCELKTMEYPYKMD